MSKPKTLYLEDATMKIKVLTSAVLSPEGMLVQEIPVVVREGVMPALKPVDTAAPKLSDAQVEEVIREAFAANKRSCDAYLEMIGGDQPLCGFAWAYIKPARGQFVKVLKKMKEGYTCEYHGGYTISLHNSCQNMDAKEAGARAFAAELRKHGVNCNVRTRID